MSTVYPVSIRRSKRAKRISLRVLPEGAIELVLPQRASERAGYAFIQSRQQWIMDALAAQHHRNSIQQPVLLKSGAPLLCFGSSFELSLRQVSGRSSVRPYGRTLIVSAPTLQKAHDALENWYKKQALIYFTSKVGEYARVLGVSAHSIRAIHMKTQWGSCNRKTRSITLNWKLALAPTEVADYVVAHEVAHLKQANHFHAFWSIVRILDPLYVKHRSWLKTYGGSLYIKKEF